MNAKAIMLGMKLAELLTREGWKAWRLKWAEKRKKSMTDTDGILDRCSECGERARFTDTGVECTECANAVFVYVKGIAAKMVAWNHEQRMNKCSVCGKHRDESHICDKIKELKK